MLPRPRQTVGSNAPTAGQHSNVDTTTRQAREQSPTSSLERCTSMSHLLKCGHRVFTENQPHKSICCIQCQYPKGFDRLEPIHECPTCFPKTCTHRGHLLVCGHFIKGSFRSQKNQRARQDQPGDGNGAYRCTKLCKVPIWPVDKDQSKCPVCDQWEREDKLGSFAEVLKEKYAELGAHQYGCYRDDFDPNKARAEIGRINSEARQACGLDVWNILQLQGPVNFLNHVARRKDVIKSRTTSQTERDPRLNEPTVSGADGQTVSLNDRNLQRLARMIVDEIHANSVSEAIYLTGLHKAQQVKRSGPIHRTISSRTTKSERIEDDAADKASMVQNMILDLNSRCKQTRSLAPMGVKESILVSTGHTWTVEDFNRAIDHYAHTSSHFLRYFRWVAFSRFSYEAIEHISQQEGEALGDMKDFQLNYYLRMLPQDYRSILERIFILFFSEPMHYRDVIWQDKNRYKRIVGGLASLTELQDLEEQIRLFDIQNPLRKPFAFETYSQSSEEDLISRIPAETFDVPEESPIMLERPEPWIDGRTRVDEPELQRRFNKAMSFIESDELFKVQEPDQTEPLRTFNHVPATNLVKKSITDGLPGLSYEFPDRPIQHSYQPFQRELFQRQPFRGQPAQRQPARGQPAQGQPYQGRHFYGQPSRGQFFQGQGLAQYLDPYYQYHQPGEEYLVYPPGAPYHVDEGYQAVRPRLSHQNLPQEQPQHVDMGSNSAFHRQGSQRHESSQDGPSDNVGRDSDSLGSLQETSKMASARRNLNPDSRLPEILRVAVPAQSINRDNQFNDGPQQHSSEIAPDQSGHNNESNLQSALSSTTQQKLQEAVLEVNKDEASPTSPKSEHSARQQKRVSFSSPTSI